MRHRVISLAAFALISAAEPASALNTRTWVSGKGVDQAGCGPIATPCRTLQYAHDATTAGGEIDVLDSAGYGAIVIGKAISIVGDGSVAGVLGSAGGTAVTINAGQNDAVTLRGLTIEGAGTATYGVVLKSGGYVEISRCVVTAFTETGIDLQMTSGAPRVVVSDTTLSRNGGVGFRYFQTTPSTVSPNIVINRVDSHHNGSIGYYIQQNSAGDATLDMRHSTASNNVNYGLAIQTATPTTGTLTVSADNLSASGNGAVGMIFGGTRLKAYLGRSVVSGNPTGVQNGGGVFSYGNNQIDGNGTNVTATIAPATFR